MTPICKNDRISWQFWRGLNFLILSLHNLQTTPKPIWILFKSIVLTHFFALQFHIACHFTLSLEGSALWSACNTFEIYSILFDLQIDVCEIDIVEDERDMMNIFVWKALKKVQWIFMCDMGLFVNYVTLKLESLNPLLLVTLLSYFSMKPSGKGALVNITGSKFIKKIFEFFPRIFKVGLKLQ